jgi:putative ABC transport system ATP-binding protein
MRNSGLPAIIEVKDLVVEYDMGRAQGTLAHFTAVDIPEWSVYKGDQVAIFGPSGCGKSTLLHVLAGLLVPKTGTVNVCGQDLGQISESERDHFRAQHIGYIFQDFNLLQGYTALENVLLGMKFSRQRPDRRQAQELLTRVGLSHREKHRPSEMSIGERQRVAIARALAGKRELILADEPTGSLDPFHAFEVVKLLGEACREHGCSLVVVSHDPGVVNAFDSSVAYMELNRAFSTVPSMTPSVVPSATMSSAGGSA